MFRVALTLLMSLLAATCRGESTAQPSLGPRIPMAVDSAEVLDAVQVSLSVFYSTSALSMNFEPHSLCCSLLSRSFNI